MATKALYEGRWEDVLPTFQDESFDLIYTDPPYGKKYKSNIPGDKKWNKSENSKNKFEDHLLNDMQGAVDWERLAKELYRLARPGAYFFLHCDTNLIVSHGHWFTDAGFNLKGQIIWNKNSAVGGDLKGAMKRDWEPILYMCKGKGILNPVEVERGGERVVRNRISETDDWTFPLLAKEQVGFPTQKPLALARQVINLTTKPDQMILDCFAGSGTIPLAADELGRSYVAIEADDKWVPKLAERLGVTPRVEEKRRFFREYLDSCRDSASEIPASQAGIVNGWVASSLDGSNEDTFHSRIREIPATKEWFDSLPTVLTT